MLTFLNIEKFFRDNKKIKKSSDMTLTYENEHWTSFQVLVCGKWPTIEHHSKYLYVDTPPLFNCYGDGRPLAIEDQVVVKMCK